MVLSLAILYSIKCQCSWMEIEFGKFWKEAVMVWLRYYPGICLERLRKGIENLSQDSQCLSRGSDWTPQFGNIFLSCKCLEAAVEYQSQVLFNLSGRFGGGTLTVEFLQVFQDSSSEYVCQYVGLPIYLSVCLSYLSIYLSLSL
jgi:hypothetical protein